MHGLWPWLFTHSRTAKTSPFLAQAVVLEKHKDRGGRIYIVVKGKIMNLGTPPVTFAPEAAVTFRESPVPFDQISWTGFATTPKYQEVSRTGR